MPPRNFGEAFLNLPGAKRGTVACQQYEQKVKLIFVGLTREPLFVIITAYLTSR